MKPRAASKKPHDHSPPEWVDIARLQPFMYQSREQIENVIGDLKSSQYRVAYMFEEQKAGQKPQITCRALQELITTGQLTLRPYIVTQRGVPSSTPIREFLAEYGIEAPPGTFAAVAVRGHRQHSFSR